MSASPPLSSNGDGDSVSGGEDDKNIEKEQLREAADGGPNDVTSSGGRDSDNTAEVDNDGNTDCGSKEQQNETAGDLDKDVDAMFESSGGRNVNQEFAGSVNVTGDISTITNDDSSVSVGPKGELSSERSYASDTDSSALAESVVKKVIGSAIEQISADGLAEEKVDKSSKDTVPEVKPSDIKVGLFQYQDSDGAGESEGEETRPESDGENVTGQDAREVTQPNVNETSPEQTAKPKEPLVGLFQYTDMGDNNVPKSPESSDAADDNGESTNEEEKDNILQLYGLEGIDPVSPKSASPDESGLDSNQDNASSKFVDVQREIYEPSTRLFSVTRDTSSNESTPRLDNNNDDKKLEETFDDKAESVIEPAVDQDDENKDILVEQSVPTEQEVANGDSDSGSDIKLAEPDNVTVESDIKLPRSDTDTPPLLAQSVSPPLIQYESVKENGKFRIIKTSKEGVGIGYQGIRVGGDILSPKESPRSIESPKQSPREPAADMEQRSEPRKETPREVVEDVLEDQIPRLETGDLVNERDDDRAIDADIELDREKIRKLLEKETESNTRAAGMRDGQSSQDSGLPRSQYSGKVSESDRKSPRQLSLSELQTSTSRDKNLSMDSDLSRIKYTTRDTTGREVKRTGPQPQYDVYDSNRYVEAPERPVYGRESHESSQTSSSYENELLRRAYDRVSHQKPSPQPNTSVQSQETTLRSQDSSVIPGFTTLQDQQAKWSDMFNTLEVEHRRELRSQYERHQYNIQRLQQQMELELQKQHLAIRKKLDIHKEALAKMSPDHERTVRRRSPDLRSPERSVSPTQRSTDRSRPTERSRLTERSVIDQSGADDLSTLQNSFDKKTWREIYREVREEEERSPSPPRPLKRSLDNDFASMDSTLDRSRPTGRRSSPRGSSDLSRSGSRERSREVTGDNALRTPVNSRQLKCEGERSLNSSRSSKSKVKDRHRSPEGRDSRSPQQSADGGAGGVSRHVKQLLDNLSDTRHGLRGIQDDISDREVTSERPRAGVYSSPMPFMSKSRFSQSTDRPVDTTLTDESSRLTQSLPLSRDRAEFYEERPRTSGGRDRTHDLAMFDDSCLSPSTRMNLREKHSKHLADLRAYYEDEVRELRKALSDSLDASAASTDMMMISPGQGAAMYDAENKRLVDKCRMLQDENEELIIKIQALEQKNSGLEKRASEYASAFTDTQAMSIQHRAHIEELQRYCRERDDIINELESKTMSNEDSVKIYKKNLEDEMELHRQDKIGLQRMIDRYDALDREYKLLQETMNATENKLYETRTDIVELNRTISKLELENKRLGRENDNLRHKVTQSLNLSTLHESFGGPSPSSPRGAQNDLNSRRPASASTNTTEAESRLGTSDQRMPGFSTSMMDWTPTSQKTRPKSADVNKSRNDVSQSSRSAVLPKERKESRTRRKDTKESDKGRQSDKSNRNIRDNSSISSSREDVSNRSHMRDVDETPTRDRTQGREKTPTRSMSPSSQADSEMSDYSPLLKAERDLFKLRDMMRQAVAVKPQSYSPPPLKLQKKFYGSERPANKDDYVPDLSVQRGRKEKPTVSSHTGVAKTKSSQTSSKSDKSSEKSVSKRSGSGKSQKSTKSRDRLEGKDSERRDKGRDRTSDRTADREEPQQADTSRQAARNGDFDTPTRFDIDFNEEKKTISVTPHKPETSGKQKNLFNGDSDQRAAVSQANNSGANGEVENTLDMMRNGQFTTRPEWENVYTSLTKQKPDQQERTRSMEEKVNERMKQISDMESRYDGLQAEKQQLESCINKIPLHGRVDRNNRRQKEQYEDRLDVVVKELGSLRMSLKRYNVLKTTG